MMTDQEIEKRLAEIFAQNYELLKMEGGHALTEAGQKDAFNQVLYYYRKLKEVASKVTDTEVKLTLPDQKTPDGRSFTIEGIVDIVREEDEVWMYDIKTHDPFYVMANKHLYEKQLNVYAYIWENLRGNPLDHTAVISTVIPDALKEAESVGDTARIQKELTKWEPVIEIPYKEDNVKDTIHDFALVVDNIEKHCFTPPPLKVLDDKIYGTNSKFATRICRNCDARFSCSSFREYATKLQKSGTMNFKKYYEDFGTDAEQEEFINASIDLDKINSIPELPQ
ncbi:PD-(D/E)XK nuclease family protein [Lacibacter sediminis]|uniref:PD-(D/E)XK nuclease family protein n=1 Tax=Lacibacter sediminis TaxID=2760713 RepID=A0A7G5XLW2_9BACT|nr:PD-(D/E)XK nuclease family protein [Lacibacter sediminis]QNA46465.1 PD-(D/E)XK nuclease family protein [Lacibacter sediminis]